MPAEILRTTKLHTHPPVRRSILYTGMLAIIPAMMFTVGISSPALAAGSGTVQACGANNLGQLGNATTTNSSNPATPMLPAGFTPTAIAAGYEFSVAVSSTGQVQSWGQNQDGDLGRGTIGGNYTTPGPVAFPPGTSITQVAAGWDHAIALSSTGQVFTWGLNNVGQLGNGSTINQGSPGQINIPGLLPGETVVKVAAGGWASYALTSTGRVFAWGEGVYGELGNGSFSNSSTPVLVSLPPGVAASDITVAQDTLAILSTAGNVYVTGQGGAGQIGNGATANVDVPTLANFPAGTVITAFGAGEYADNLLALSATGQVFSWGAGGSGQLGTGSTSNSSTPVMVSLPAGASPVTSLAAGNSESYLVTSTGQLLATGGNGSGQACDGSTASRTTFEIVPLPAGTTVNAVAGGTNHMLAIVNSALPVPLVDPVIGGAVGLVALAGISRSRRMIILSRLRLKRARECR